MDKERVAILIAPLGVSTKRNYSDAPHVTKFRASHQIQAIQYSPCDPTIQNPSTERECGDRVGNQAVSACLLALALSGESDIGPERKK